MACEPDFNLLADVADVNRLCETLLLITTWSVELLLVTLTAEVYFLTRLALV